MKHNSAPAGLQQGGRTRRNADPGGMYLRRLFDALGAPTASQGGSGNTVESVVLQATGKEN